MNSMQFSEPPVGTLFGDEEIAAIRRVLHSGESLNRGKDVTAFEQEFAAYCGAPHAVAVSSCASALRIAMQLLRLRPGDEVIIQANAFWNTVCALAERGVTMKVADILPYALTMDPESIEPLITKKTKGIWILSLGGNPCDMDRICAIGKKHGIPIVEDAAHSAGASYKGRKIGSISDITCFSFSTLKNMCTLGEGGMITTLNSQHADEAAKLRESWPMGKRAPQQRKGFGAHPKPADTSFMRPGDAYDAEWTILEEVGTNCKMSSIAAAVGREQLKKLDRHNAMRKTIADAYDAGLRGLPGIRLLDVPSHATNSWHLYNFFVLPEAGIDRDALIGELQNRHGLQIINRFWPIHLHNILRLAGHEPGEAPVCERVWFREQVALPIAPSMDDKRVKWVIETVKTAYNTLK